MPEQFNLRLVSREYVAKDTMEFKFRIIDNTLTFKPGQHIQLMIPELYDKNKVEGTRFFSLISDPADHESLSIATRLSNSTFKRYLLTSDLNRAFIAFGPLGSFVAPHGEHPLLLFALGIGITALLPILKENTISGNRKIFLFYINNKLEEVAFASELFNLQQKHAYFNFYPYLLGGNLGLESYRSGKPSNESIIEVLGTDLLNVDVMMAGPPRQIYEFRKQLQSIGIPQTKTKVEIFSGYQ
ncbi:MAG: FAD-dependent oxidoreductase [Thermoplasmata archaeon]